MGPQSTCACYQNGFELEKKQPANLPLAHNFFPVPAPTFLHPRSRADAARWVAHVRAQPRPHRIMMVVGKRKGMRTRDDLIHHCPADPQVWPPQPSRLHSRP